MLYPQQRGTTAIGAEIHSVVKLLTSGLSSLAKHCRHVVHALSKVMMHHAVMSRADMVHEHALHFEGHSL